MGRSDGRTDNSGLGSQGQTTHLPGGYSSHIAQPVDELVVDLRSGDIRLTHTDSAPLSVLYRTAKRGLDVSISVVLAALISPVLVAIAATIKLTSPGPVFFRQERVGRAGRSFLLLKFRTMVDGADESYHENHYAELANGNGSTLLIEDDPRVTYIGRFLRRWSLDELPNLWNVIKGDISLVGPRPLVPYELRLHDAEYLRRLHVLPGITGLAQVNGRLHLHLNERADLDLEYVDGCSFWLDIKILARTIPALFHRPGA